jgi:peptidoglycan hydrolase-like protein with peptidoglycan-binding domain
MNRGLAWGLALLGGLGAGFGGFYLYERLRTPASTTPPGGPIIIYSPPPTPPAGQPSSGQPSSGQPSSGQPSSRPPSTNSGQQTTNCATQLANGQLYLQEGSTGPCVQLVQQLLNQWGMTYGYGGFPGSGPLTVDGDFGPLTRQAVLAFQQREGISVDGIVGPQTWGRLSQMTPPVTSATSPSSTSSTGTPGNPCGEGWWVYQANGFYTLYPVEFQAVPFAVCMPNVPQDLPSDFGYPQCTVYIGMGELTVVSDTSVLAPYGYPTLYGVAKYDNNHLTQVYVQTQPLGLGQVVAGLFCPSGLPQNLPLPWPG